MPAPSRLPWPGLLALALAACAPSPAPAPATTTPSATSAQPAGQAQNEVQAQKDLELYRKLLAENQLELAAPIGKEMIARFPQSAAAKEVQTTLADITAKADALTQKRRLQGLWSYQSGKESGGSQNTASIYSRGVGNDDRVRLILRRHSAWGQSAYLFGSGKGFDCSGNCMIGAHFDDQPVRRLKAYLPETGEPAIFISDDKAFIERMGSAQSVSIDLVEKGKGARTLVFETGGFEAARFPVLAKTPTAAKKK